MPCQHWFADYLKKMVASTATPVISALIDWLTNGCGGSKCYASHHSSDYLKKTLAPTATSVNIDWLAEGCGGTDRYPSHCSVDNLKEVAALPVMPVIPAFIDWLPEESGCTYHYARHLTQRWCQSSQCWLIDYIINLIYRVKKKKRNSWQQYLGFRVRNTYFLCSLTRV